MATNDKTVYDGGTTVPDFGSTTVPETGGTTVLETGGATDFEGAVAEAAIAEAAAYKGEFLSNDDIQKGNILLDTYRVDSNPIHGGMGSVWRVHHQNWNVDLAMKRPQAKLFANETQKTNFIRECEAWINLGLHPNIVSCYYVREMGGIPTIFSEWMENGSLENRIQDGSVYEGAEEDVQMRLLDIAIQFARGLHYAHEAGLIHQDVKPDNLLLSREWDAKVADFGLARARAQLTAMDGAATVLDSDPGATAMAPSGGYTPAYCSMEQMDGKPLTRRTDIYSWAVSIMELYLGERPWVNGVAAGLACRDYFERCRIPMLGSLCELLAQCMAQQPEERPHDFGMVEAALQDIYREVVGADYSRLMPRAAVDTADSLNNRALSFLDLGQKAAAEALWDQALAVDPGHLDSLYNQGLLLWRTARIHDVELAKRLTSARDCDRRKELMRRVQEERGPAALSPLANVTGGKNAQLAFSADGRYLLLTENQEHGFAILDPDNGRSIGRVDNGGAETGCELRPGKNGDVFWSSGADALVRYSIRDGAPTDFFANENDSQHIWSFSLSADETRAVGLLRSKRDIQFFEIPHVIMWDIRHDRRLFERKCQLCGSIFLSPDGKRFAAANNDINVPAVEVWDAEQNVLLFSLSGHTAPIISLAVSPDFTMALSLSRDASVKRWSLITGACLATYHLGEISGREQLRLFPDCTRALILNSGEKKLIRVLALSSGRILASIGDTASGNPQQSVADIDSRCGRIAVACEDGRVFTCPVPACIQQADWSLSVISETAEHLNREAAFKRHLSSAEELFDRRSLEDALTQLRLAREIEGFSSHPQYRSLARRVGQYCTISSLRECFLAKTLEGHWKPPRFIALRGDMRLAVSACGESSDRQVLLWNVDSGGWEWQIDTPMCCMAADFSPDGKSILVHSTRSIVRHELVERPYTGPDGAPAWEVHTKPTEGYPTASRYVSFIRFHPDGRHFAACVGVRLCMWELGKKNPIYQVELPSVSALALTPDGRHIAVAMKNDPVTLFDFFTGKPVRSYRESALALCISPDGAILAVAGEREMRIIEIATGKVVAVFPSLSPGACICFSHDSRFLWHSMGKNLCLRSIETGEALFQMQGALTSITALCASGNGEFLLSASMDNTISRFELDWDYTIT